MKRLIAIALLAASPAFAAGPARPQRIVSLNLCADQLVLALADRGQIAGLTRNAADPAISGEAARARGLRLLGQSAEQVLEIRPDLIVTMGRARGGILGVLAAQDYRILGLKTGDTYPEIVASVREVAKAVGHPERGEALIARMDAELKTVGPVGGGRVAAYYQRRGFMTGTGTLIDDLMTRLGLVNLAGRLGRPALSQLGLEELVAARPDYLIVESATDRVTDQGTEMLHHPVLDAIPRLRVPQAWTVCASPAYATAARSLAAQISSR